MNASKRGSKSKRKGKSGELEAVHFLAEMGIFARRGVQYDGSQGAADVVGPAGVHIEIKRYARITPGIIGMAIRQSTRDARKGEAPIVMHRQDRGPWKVSLTMESLGIITGAQITGNMIVSFDAEDFWQLWKEART